MSRAGPMIRSVVAVNARMQMARYGMHAGLGMAPHAPAKAQRMRKRWLAPVAAVTLWAIVGCSGYPYGPNHQDVGMVIGGALGGALGSQIGGGTGRTVAIIAGTLLGAAVGGDIGRHMDEVDRMRTAQALESVRTGVSARWRNPDSGNQYTVTPTRTYDKPAGPCREYVVDAVVEGRREKVYGNACRQADGSWQAQG
jgi:surface antigen